MYGGDDRGGEGGGVGKGGVHRRKCFTLRKKSPPDGKIMRCDPGSTLSGSPSLYQEIIGDGTPSALQFNVTGS